MDDNTTMKTTLVLALSCLVCVAVEAAEASALRLVQTIPLPGVKGRFDHFAIDLKGQRLFVAALGNMFMVMARARGEHWWMMQPRWGCGGLINGGYPGWLLRRDPGLMCRTPLGF